MSKSKSSQYFKGELLRVVIMSQNSLTILPIHIHYRLLSLLYSFLSHLYMSHDSVRKLGRFVKYLATILDKTSQLPSCSYHTLTWRKLICILVENCRLEDAG